MDGWRGGPPVGDCFGELVGSCAVAGFRAPELGAGTGSVAGFCDEGELAPSAPYASTTIVTRRFCDRPSRVLLSAIGSLSP